MRKQNVQDMGNFDCKCSLYTASPADQKASEERRTKISILGDILEETKMTKNNGPAKALGICRLNLDFKEAEGEVGTSNCTTFGKAFQICVATEDMARASG
ncbi:MAG: hypothetical protein M1814_002901 [Vezdaea aestivalis]|nr:MAG: hypothetical protein M1814_002901 [Vezdaea aestivalis]